MENQNNEPKNEVCYWSPRASHIYCISMTPGKVLDFCPPGLSRLDEQNLTYSVAHDAAVMAAQAQIIYQNPGLRMKLLLHDGQNFTLRPYSGSKDWAREPVNRPQNPRRKLYSDPNDWGEELVDYPDLAISGRLMGWKLYGVTIPVSGAVKLCFYNVWDGVHVRAGLLLGDDETLHFTMEALGENGKTMYECKYDETTGCTVVHEMSEYHERYVTIDERGHCQVRELLMNG